MPDYLASVVIPALWIVSRYLKDNPIMHTLDRESETVWGWRTCEISETWRKYNEARKSEASRTRRVTAGPPSGRTIGRNLIPLAGPPITSFPPIVLADGTGDPHLPPPSITSRYSGDLEWRTLPSLESVGLLDSFDNRRTNSDPKAPLPPLSKGREW